MHFVVSRMWEDCRMDIKQVREEIDYADERPLEYPLVHVAKWLLE